jgi:hypothetical protein
VAGTGTASRRGASAPDFIGGSSLPSGIFFGCSLGAPIASAFGPAGAAPQESQLPQVLQLEQHGVQQSQQSWRWKRLMSRLRMPSCSQQSQLSQQLEQQDEQELVQHGVQQLVQTGLQHGVQVVQQGVQQSQQSLWWKRLMSRLRKLSWQQSQESQQEL